MRRGPKVGRAQHCLQGAADEAPPGFELKTFEVKRLFTTSRPDYLDDIALMDYNYMYLNQLPTK